MMTGCKPTLFCKAWGKAKANTKSRKKFARTMTTSTRARSELSRAPDVEQTGWITGVTINSVSSTRRQVGAEKLLLNTVHSFTHVRSEYPRQRVPYTASGARLQHDGGRFVTSRLPSGRTIRVLSHACKFQRPILSVGCLAQQVHCSDLTGTFSFLGSRTQLHKEESLFFVKGMLNGALGDSWCE